MEEYKIQRVGGLCAVFEALIYIFAFIVYGAILEYPPASATNGDQIRFLSENYRTLSVLNFISYVLFGIILAVLVLAIHNRMKGKYPFFSQLALVFGVIWVGLVISSGMVANLALYSIIDIGGSEPEKAMQIWQSVGLVTEGLGGGNEIVGGIWVLLLSIIGLIQNSFSKLLNSFGVLVGIVGVLTIIPLVIPLDIFTELFGISQIVWFLWIGISMIRKPRVLL